MAKPYIAGQPPLPALLRLHEVDFSFDQRSERRVHAKYRRLLRQHAPESCMVFTFTGMFETRRDWYTTRLVYPDGSWKYAGFGHLGGAPGRLVMRSEDNVELEPGCVAKGTRSK
jgi:hypothetical protein